MGARDEFIAALAAQHYRAHLLPPPVLSCAEWADKFRQIAKGPEKGRWRTDRTPYLREPMACTDPEHPCHKVILMFATQLGKTEVEYNALLKRIHLQPVDMMMVQPTLNDAKDHSRQRFTPTVRLMPEAEARMPPPRSRDEQNTWQTKEIRGGATLFFAGANSARSLASKPLGFVVCDEIDGYPLDVDGEGDPLGLVWERMSNFPTRKLVLTSTPTLRGFSRIEDEFNASDRRRYFVPCPHCAEAQVLVWGADKDYGIKWLKTPSGQARADTAVYVCQHCGASIEERSKPVMLHEGRWVPDDPGAQRGLVAGFHLSKLYSPLGWKSWAMLVEDWAKAREANRAGDNSKLKTFVNTSLAETWVDGDEADSHELQKRAGDWQPGVVQWGMHVCTVGVDVQRDRLECFKWAWGRGFECQLVDREVIYGDPFVPEGEQGSPWNRMTEYRRLQTQHAGGQTIATSAVFIDSGDGHTTQPVYAYTRTHQREHVHAIKGSSIAGKVILGKPTQQEVNWRGVRIKRGVKVWPIGTDTAKALIYGRLRLSKPGPGFVHLSQHFPGDVFEQLTAERMATKYVKGRARVEWILPPGKRNEALDGAVYALAAAFYAGIDRWTEAEWGKLDATKARAPAPAVATAPAVAQPSMRGRVSLSGHKRFAS